jgi:hypothetical protein
VAGMAVMVKNDLPEKLVVQADWVDLCHLFIVRRCTNTSGDWRCAPVPAVGLRNEYC